MVVVITPWSAHNSGWGIVVSCPIFYVHTSPCACWNKAYCHMAKSSMNWKVTAARVTLPRIHIFSVWLVEDGKCEISLECSLTYRFASPTIVISYVYKLWGCSNRCQVQFDVFMWRLDTWIHVETISPLVTIILPWYPQAFQQPGSCTSGQAGFESAHLSRWEWRWEVEGPRTLVNHDRISTEKILRKWWIMFKVICIYSYAW